MFFFGWGWEWGEQKHIQHFNPNSTVEKVQMWASISVWVWGHFMKAKTFALKVLNSLRFKVHKLWQPFFFYSIACHFTLMTLILRDLRTHPTHTPFVKKLLNHLWVIIPQLRTTSADSDGPDAVCGVWGVYPEGTAKKKKKGSLDSLPYNDPKGNKRWTHHKYFPFSTDSTFVVDRVRALKNKYEGCTIR